MALDHFESVDLTFRLGVTPRERNASLNSGIIVKETASKSNERGKRGIESLLEPRVEKFRGASANERSKIASKRNSESERRVVKL